MNSSTFNHEIQKIQVHDHLCFIYHSRQEWEDFILAYIRDGLARGERCLYIFDTHTHRQIRAVLNKGGIPVNQVEAEGRLVLMHGSRLYLSRDQIDPESAIPLLVEAEEKALQSGFSGLRLTFESDWLLHSQPGPEKHLDYLNHLTGRLFKQYRCTGTGQYDFQQFKPELIRDLLLIYPGLIQKYSLSYKNFQVSSESLWREHPLDLDPHFWMAQIEREDRLVRGFRDTAYRLLTLFSQTPTPIMVLDEDRRIVESNTAACRLLEANRDDLLGRTARDFLRPDCAAALGPDFDLFSSFKDLEVNCLINGVHKSIVINNVIIESARGRLAYLMGLDITERKQLEARALHFSAIVESSDAGIISLDFQGNIISWNARAARLLGHSAAEMIGRSIQAAFPPGCGFDLVGLLERVAAGEIVREETVNLPGGLPAARLRAFPITSPQGGLAGISMILAEKE